MSGTDYMNITLKLIK